MKNIFFGLYFLHLIVKFAKIDVPIFFSSYFADLLCLPIFLYVITFFMKKVRQNQDFSLDWKMIFFVWAYISIAFEIALPYFSKRYTADFGDVICYALGAVFSYFFEKNN